MISLDISLNESQFRTARDSLLHIPGAAEKTIARAVNRAVEGARTDAIKAVCAEYAIKATDVRKSIHIKRATPGNPVAQVISTGSPIPLIKFKVTPRKPRARGEKKKTVVAGVKFGNAKPMPHSFVARMKSGHVGVYSRKDGTGRTIKQHYSPSVPQMMGNEKALEYIEKRAYERLDKELRHQVGYLFSGGR
jgi:hypothetical protein